MLAEGLDYWASFRSGIFVKLKYYDLFSILLYFVISLKLIVKLSPLLVVFFSQGFPRKSCIFPLFCISLLCH